MGGQGSALPRSASQCVVLLQWIIKPSERSASSFFPLICMYSTQKHTKSAPRYNTDTLPLSHILTIKNKQFIFSRFSHFLFFFFFPLSCFSFSHNRTGDMLKGKYKTVCCRGKKKKRLNLYLTPLLDCAGGFAFFRLTTNPV